jgi:hypothetical protein
MLTITKTVAPVEQSKHIAHSQCDVTKTIRIHRYRKHLFQNREDLFFMKNKTKVVLGLAAMLAGTAGIAGVSTFAWFTTQSTADLGFTDAVVRGDNTYIGVGFSNPQPENGFSTTEGVANNGVTITPSTNDKEVKITGAAVKMIDLSGDASIFYHPNNYQKNSDTETAQSITHYTANTSTVTYFLTYNITVTNKADTPTDVYLNSASVTAVSTAAPADVAAAKATRVAIFDVSTPATPVLKTMWQQTTETSYSYLKTVANTGAIFGLTGQECEPQTINPAATNPTDPVEQVFHVGAFTASGTTDKGQSLGHLAALGDTKTYNIRMWIEGTMKVAINTCIGGHVALALQLRGQATA